MPSPGLGSSLQGGKSLQQIPVSITSPPFLQGGKVSPEGAAVAQSRQTLAWEQPRVWNFVSREGALHRSFLSPPCGVDPPCGGPKQHSGSQGEASPPLFHLWDWAVQSRLTEGRLFGPEITVWTSHPASPLSEAMLAPPHTPTLRFTFCDYQPPGSRQTSLGGLRGQEPSHGEEDETWSAGTELGAWREELGSCWVLVPPSPPNPPLSGQGTRPCHGRAWMYMDVYGRVWVSPYSDSETPVSWCGPTSHQRSGRCWWSKLCRRSTMLKKRPVGDLELAIWS